MHESSLCQEWFGIITLWHFEVVDHQIPTLNHATPSTRVRRDGQESLARYGGDVPPKTSDIWGTTLLEASNIALDRRIVPSIVGS